MIGGSEQAECNFVERNRSEPAMRLERDFKSVGAAEMDAGFARPLDPEGKLDPSFSATEERVEKRIAFARRDNQRGFLQLRAKENVQVA